jgi:hypothetical protein
VWDVALPLLPLLFLTFAGAAARLNQQPQSAWGEQVRRAAQLGPSVFPILFAVIVRRTLRMVARWRAERGARLGALEELVGSGSLFGAVETQLLLRSCSATGVLLFVLWALSPVGGQAALRLLDLRAAASESSRTLWYLAQGREPATVFEGGSNLAHRRDTIASLYQASPLAPKAVLHGPEDTWGNVKIPYLEKLSASATDRDGWVAVPSSNVPYSSLLGVPVTGQRPEDANVNASDFRLETEYYTLECPELHKVHANELAVSGVFNSTMDATANDCTRSSRRDTYWTCGSSKFRFLTRTNWTDARLKEADPAPRDIIWQSRAKYENGLTWTQSFCSLALSHVEVNVSCVHHDGIGRRQCRVTQMRPSRLPHLTPSLTPFENSRVAKIFLNEWPQMQRMVGSAVSSATEYYIMNGDLPFRPTEGYYLALWKLAPAVFAQRLSICWNTYWQAGLVPTFQAGGLPAAKGDGDVDYEAAAAAGDVILPLNGGFRVNATTARMVRLTPRYVCHAHWLALLVAASSALLLSGVAGLVAKHAAVVPDVLTYVSSLTRDNPHIPLGPGGNTLDGMVLKEIVVATRFLQLVPSGGK